MARIPLHFDRVQSDVLFHAQISSYRVETFLEKDKAGCVHFRVSCEMGAFVL